MTKLNFSIFAAPVLCLGVLGGIIVQDRTHLQPADVKAYHAAAKAAIEAWPKTIDNGNWTAASDMRLPASAEQLLHPNCVVQREYSSQTVRVNGYPTQVCLLIVQCKDSRDMAGHYPPICYPSSGCIQISGEPFELPAGGVTIHGIEYQFLRQVFPAIRQTVYDFFIVPGKGFVPDMTGVRAAAKSYQARYYGAAQFQVVMNADYPQEIREQIFKMIIGANPRAFTVLNTVEKP